MGQVDEPSDGLPDRRDSSHDTTHLAIGRILGARGLSGELKVHVLTDFPQRFSHLKTVLVGDELEPYVVERARLHRGIVIVKLKDCNTANEAARLRGKMLSVPLEEAVPLPPGQYYWYQIIGLEVWTAQGQFVGVVADILPTGSADVYVVQAEDREVLIPAIEDVIKAIDLDGRRIVIEPMPGLL
ncbi:MAG: 16S rRNA processing protein RimM [Chloroflexi bacterium]|nr:16S rRNA processing protein RimM [Chloroflexota bacterium]